MDKVFIHGLKVSTIIGVHPWEWRVRQLVEIDLELDVPLRNGPPTDDLVDTIDYGAVARTVADHVSSSRVALLETLAESVADLVLRNFNPRGVSVRLSKPGAVPAAEKAGVYIER